MSRWVKYIGVLTPLLGFLVPVHWVNAAVLPFAGGVLYGLAASKRRDLFLSPAVVLIPAALVFVYYFSADYVRAARFVAMFPIFIILWLAFWATFFTLGAVAGYVLRRTDKKA
ncbi:MAG: hypothetical protein QXP31_01330 [Pyrobaculum sp.]